QTAVGKGKRHARRKVPEEILSAEPIGNDRYLGMHGLFVSCDDTSLRSAPRRSTRINAIRPNRNPRTITAALYLLAEVSIDQSEGIDRVSMIPGRVEDCS